MYETEERIIEQAEHLAAEPPFNLVGDGEIANDAATITAIQGAINTRESAVTGLLPVYQELRSHAAFDPRCNQLSRRAWHALLEVEKDKDSLLFDLYQLRVGADRYERSAR